MQIFPGPNLSSCYFVKGVIMIKKISKIILSFVYYPFTNIWFRKRFEEQRNDFFEVFDK